MRPRALIAEPSAPVAAALRSFLEEAGLEVSVVSSAEEALQRAPGHALLLASVSAALDAEALCRSLRARAPQLGVLLAYAPDADHAGAGSGAHARAEAAGADGCVVGPLKRSTVVSAARLVLAQAGARDQLQALQAQLEAAQAGAAEARAHSTALAPAPDPAPDDYAFLERFLTFEARRSRRYRYPIALLRVGPDGWAERVAPLPHGAREALATALLGRVRAGVRDIDLAAQAPGGQVLVFLPHTPRDGARVVAERLRERLQGLPAAPGLTVSVGVAVFEPGAGRAPVSFPDLLQAAEQALARAQAAGGDRVDAPERTSRRDRISLG
jgi:PleD family two-component response regulator